MTSIDPTRIDIKFDPQIQRMSGVAYHGNTPFDVPFISQIEGNLWQGGCERGLILPEFIEHVVSLYPWEEYYHNLSPENHIQIKMYDSESQAFDQVDEIAAKVNEFVEQGPTLVHCQAGLNRSSLVAARSLMLKGRTADEAISLIRESRSPACLCNPSFEGWLRSIDGKAALNRLREYEDEIGLGADLDEEELNF
ncbi:PTPc tyrosine phosphatase [Rhodococcus phage NiceHouse]|nr:PTPc tyrosine phosphatase [Rhodococcus phage NiceHouse]